MWFGKKKSAHPNKFFLLPLMINRYIFLHGHMASSFRIGQYSELYGRMRKNNTWKPHDGRHFWVFWFLKPVRDSSYRLNLDQGKENEIQPTTARKLERLWEWVKLQRLVAINVIVKWRKYSPACEVRQFCDICITRGKNNHFRLKNGYFPNPQKAWVIFISLHVFGILSKSQTLISLSPKICYSKHSFQHDRVTES
jgi:hypothetical protein